MRNPSTDVAKNQSIVPVLEIRGAGFGYGQTVVVDIAAFDLLPGERVAMVGPSGCGKTTILSTIAGAREPLYGTLQIQGEARDALWRSQNTARTIQSFPLFHWLTVRQNVRLACRIRGVAHADIDAILAEFSATALADRYPQALSGGERCRASLAQAAVASPRLLLLDEPFTGLDTLVKEDVAQTLYEFAQNRQIPVLLVTHDLDDAVHFSERVVVLGENSPTRVLAEVHTSESNALNTVRETLRRNAHD